MRPPPRRPSLSHHFDFRQLWIGDGFGQVGAQLTLLALPIYAVATLGANEIQMGYLTASQTAAFLVIGLPAGAWVDRMRKRRILIVADVVRAVILAVVVALALTGHGSMAMLYGAGLLLSIATVFFDVAHLSFVPGLVGLDRVSEGSIKLQATASVAQVSVPAIGGALLRVVTAPILIAVNVVTYVVSAVFVMRIKHVETMPPRGSHLPLFKAIKEGLAFIVRTPTLNRLVFCTSGTAFFATMVMSMTVFFVVTTLGLGATAVGLVLSAQAMGGLLGALTARWATQRIGEGRIIVIAAAVTPVLFIGLPLAPLFVDMGADARIPLIVSGFAAQITQTWFNVSQVAFRQRLCPPHLLGRMNASFRFIVWGPMPLAGLAAGWIAAAIGVPIMLGLALTGQFLATMPLVFSPMRTMRTLPGSRAEDVVD